MANLAELWLKEYGEASRLADEVSKMLSECGSLPPSEPETQRHLSSMIRRMRILSARLGNLETDLTSIPRKSRFSLLRKFTSDKEMRKRQEMLSNLRVERVQNRLAILNERNKAGCFCVCLLLSALVILILASIVLIL